ncbi:hypothetical protein BDB00DRAFT_876073 [Zychaea mexicana]|uniref:uncharacterized protein n=1 Tax=Zychaea mexicana TaxID=64656 RepID=UPI0022FDCC66|nr:uncharacterized protein BDB00DRAFT_876073 [Zychaea mexicana]KAI9489729.1 hypothetical protein BDB00DRAFT_876073 [Zychaea mexicana]
MDYNPERVECFCPECFRSSIFGFREVTLTRRFVNTVSAPIATFEGEQPSLSEASDNMDIDEMDIGDDVSNEPSTSRSLAIHDIDAPSSSPAAASHRLSFSDEDNVFGVEEDRDSVGGTERLLDAEDVEWDVEADNVNEEETASIDEQVALPL